MEEIRQSKNNKTKIMLLTSLFLYNFSASLYSNSLPLIILALGLGPVEVSLSSFLVNLTFILLASHAGSLGDRTGARRGIMILGTLFLFLSISIIISFYNYISVLLASVLSGIASAFFSSNAVMAVVEVGSLSGERRPERSLAQAGLASGSGWFLGLLLGGLLVKIFGLREGLIFGIPMIAFAIFSIMLAKGPLVGLEREIIFKPHMLFLGVAERIRMLFYYIPRIITPFKRSSKPSYLDPFMSYLVAMMMAFMGISLFFTQIPVFMRRVLRIPNSEVMTLMSIHNGVSTIMFGFLGTRSLIIRPLKALEIAFSLRSLAFILPLTTKILDYKLIMPITFLITGSTWALINVSTNTITLDLGGMEKGGERMGQLNGAISLGILVGSLVSGIIVQSLGFMLDFLLASTLILVTLVWIRRILGK